MRLIVAVVVVAVISSCKQPPPKPATPAEPVARAAPVDAGPALPPPEFEDESALPDDLVVDDTALDGEPFARLLLRDPVRADTLLQEVAARDPWQVSLLAQLARRRGHEGPEPVPEPPLPVVRPTMAASAPAVAEGKTAWVVTDSLTLVLPTRKATTMQLPINTPVRVTSLDGGVAQVEVDVATEVDFGRGGNRPESVTTQTVQGTVDAQWLVGAPLDARVVMAEAMARSKPNGGLNRDEVTALWRSAWLIERSERTREGFLRAALTAGLAIPAAEAAVPRMMARTTTMELAWACRGDVTKAKWLRAGAAKLPADVCVTGVDARAVCPYAPEPKRRSGEAARAWREAQHLEESPRLRLTVDAREPRVVLLASSGVSLRDECDQFQERRIESSSATLRRLWLPLGTANTVVRVLVPRYHGTEYDLVSTTELKAAGWLRARAHGAWTVGEHGKLEVSLGVGQSDFTIEKDVPVVTVMTSPDRECRCQ